jgi:hypothetical protein
MHFYYQYGTFLFQNVNVPPDLTLRDIPLPPSPLDDPSYYLVLFAVATTRNIELNDEIECYRDGKP